ncbi:MAG: cupin-like domain-containing protein [Algicola sp.]|nr:cupin-like domain-containing protein [Algicola sp.]
MKLEKQIQVVNNISKQDFQSDFVIPQIPVVIKNAVNHWAAFEKWQPDYLEQQVGDLKVSLKKSESFKHPDANQKDPGATMQLTFAQYLQKTVFNDDMVERKKYYLSGDENFFYTQGKQNPAYAPIADDFKVPELFDHNRLRDISFWLSVQGMFSWLHFDGNGCHNLNVQVAGSKRVQLFHPDQVSKLYPITLRENIQGFNFSKIDLVDYQASKFPLSKDAVYQETILEAGDMLFIPAVWYHGIHHLGDVNMNVNFWWQPETVQLSSNVMRSELLKTAHEAYLSKVMDNYDNPKWENWCKDEVKAAELLFACDEHLIAR